MKEQIRDMIMNAGAVRVGFARTDASGCVPASVMHTFDRWLARGHHGEMKWMENHRAIREAPSRLLDGPDAPARPVSVVVAAFAYRQPVCRNSSLPHIARFAYGEDYHKVLPRRLKPVCRHIEQQWGAKTRICVDSAPILERYWAQRAGVGRQGLSGLLIVPETGTYCLLAEIVTDLELEPDEPLTAGCLGCRRCLEACPSEAICGDGTINATRCHSYLTIENPRQGKEEEKELPLFGCDKCQIVCPHNRNADTSRCLPEFMPDENMLSLTREEFYTLSPEEFRHRYGHTPLMRLRKRLLP